MIALRRLHQDDELQLHSVGALGEQAAENRRAPRRRMLKGAVAAFSGRHCSIPCTVRDFSDSGARLRSDASVTIPDHFELIIALDGIEAECEVVWRKDRDLGVRFVAPPRQVGAKRQQIAKSDATERLGTLRRRPERPQPDMSNRLETRARADLIGASQSSPTCNDLTASTAQPAGAQSDDLLMLLLAIQPEIARICVLAAVSSNLANALASGMHAVKPRTLIRYYPRESAVLISATQRLRRRFSPSELFSLLDRFHIHLAAAKQATLAAAAGGLAAVGADTASECDLANAWKSICSTGRDLLLALDKALSEFEITGSAIELAPLLSLLESSIAGDCALVVSDGTIDWPQWAERRDSKRVPIRCPAVLTHGAHQQRVVVRDISANGIGLDATQHIGLGEHVVVQLGQSRKLEGKVMWTADGRAAIRLHRPVHAHSPQLKFLVEGTSRVSSIK